MESCDDKKNQVNKLHILMQIIYMSQYLPYGQFKWFNQKEVDEFCLNSIRENSSDWYILEVDLKYFDELHELYNDYPLAREKHEISHNM